MRLHLIRHGETRHNADNRIQGSFLDDPLNDTGRAQAAALARHYAASRERIHAVYTSPLRRARTTARAVARALGLPEPQVLPGLRELDWGAHNGKLNVGATRVDMTRVLGAWESGDFAARVQGGETPPEAWARAIAEIAPLARAHEDETVVVVAHGRLNKVLLSGLLHGHVHHMERYPQANAGITVLDGPAPWRLVRANATAHLAGLRAQERAE